MSNASRMRCSKSTECVGLVTGGGGEIGSAIAARMAREGAGVVVADIDRDKAEATAAAIRTAGGQAQA